MTYNTDFLATYAKSGSTAEKKYSAAYCRIGTDSGLTYRTCIGFNAAALKDKDISRVRLYMRGVDNQGSTSGTWTAKLASSNAWSYTSLASATLGRATQGGGTRWYYRDIPMGALVNKISALGGTLYLHITGTDFKVYQGGTASDRPYLQIEYADRGSVGKLSSDTVVAGNSITLTITPIEEGATHTVKWSCGSQPVITHELAAGVLVDTVTIPEEWASESITQMTVQAACTLDTIVGAETSTQVIPFNVQTPSSSGPIVTATIEAVNGIGYYQHCTAAKITITSAIAQQGASIVSYRITGSEGVSTTNTSITTPTFQTAGPHTYVVHVTDSRGLSTDVTLTATVIAVAPAVLGAFVVQRYATDPETGAHVSPAGDHVWLTASATIDLAGGNNTTPSVFRIRYWPNSDADDVTIINLSMPGTGVWQPVADQTIITAQISLSDGYTFALDLTDKTGAVSSLISTINKSTVAMHIRGDGTGVAIGGYSLGSDRFDVFVPTYLHGGIKSGLSTGRVNNTSVNANSYADVSVSFGTTFASAPAVIVTPETGSTAVNTGSVSYGILTGSITTTGFKIRIFNNTSNSRGYAFRWLAFEE